MAGGGAAVVGLGPGCRDADCGGGRELNVVSWCQVETRRRPRRAVDLPLVPRCGAAVSRAMRRCGSCVTPTSQSNIVLDSACVPGSSALASQL